jgi:hypothetical protein
MKRACLIALFVTSTTTARADQKSADACPSKLSTEPAAIYSSTVAQISPGVNIRDVVVSVTRGMVMAGRLSRTNARPAAEAAGSCLALIRK